MGAPDPCASMPAVPHHHVAIVGTGFGGIGAAVKLLEEKLG